MKGTIGIYLVFGVAFLPGFLSDSLDQRTAYLTEIIGEKTDGIEAYEFEPLLSREKRQVPITNPLSSEGTTPSPKPESKVPVAGIWANKTRDVTTPSPTTDKSSLLRKSGNVFAQNNATQPTATTLAPSEDDGITDLSVSDSVQDLLKGTNLTEKTDDLQYYVSNYLPPAQGKAYWNELTTNPDAKRHEMLSSAHRRAATLKPNFNFLFYGHKIANFTVATGGFIYTGDQVHAWLAATQYIAPLMANFESTPGNSSVWYLSTNNSFTVQWDQVRLQDAPDKGNFTFQSTLYDNGTIIFAYKNIPILIKDINETQHPVKVGMSDAYIRDRHILVLKQKTIYEYHRIDLKDTEKEYHIVNGAAIIFNMVDTCITYSTCETCTADNITNFECAWCPVLNRCSSGLDRFRQEWVNSHCDKEHVNVQLKEHCPALSYNYTSNSTPSSTHHEDHDHDHEESDEHDHDNDHGSIYSDHSHQDKNADAPQVQKARASEAGGTSAGGVVAIMFFLIVIFGGVGWLAYAYFYPHTPSGQLLIRYRPSQWGLRRGEARYTAASIHM